ncbi:RNA-3'-phosphate cyclase [Blastocystis hominis]|uniref:RNA-3'-phosphate cyclase n=1 Tax=Blastocystis hominis TaxID=12968 RepID=D8LX22_BLAHO|nr:RNA-3'-phosphate cyclase [Blastocystis hominis]CBK20817.2 RNA-3'-phosphate cyclase [Blastocystis hominis]|eukprot:XP_012894865.1 RNA-3'-phosphate cyclase [Blastocystis hominis]
MRYITFKGPEQLRYRIIVATLTRKPIVITNIREDDENPGMKDYEVKFLKMVSTLSSGCEVDINETGTRLLYKPGFINGGKYQFHCGEERGIGYFLMGLLPLLLFGKVPSKIVFSGITNNKNDISVDIIRIVTLPLLAKWGVTEGCSLQIKKRGAEPNGGGEVIFNCPTMRELDPVDLTDAGVVKRVRGVVYTMRVSPVFADRVITSCRGLFNKFIPDVHIFKDHYTGTESGRSPGYGVTLLAETVNHYNYCAEMMGVNGALAEELGVACSELLLEEIARGGCIDSIHQPLAVLLMAFSPEDVSKIRTGPLTTTTVGMLRLLRDMIGIVFRLRPDGDEGGVLISCVGSGYKNISRKVT